MDAEGLTDALNDPNRLELNGRLQHEVAALALRHSGVNHDLAGSIEDFLESHEVIAGDSQENEVGMTTGFSGEAAIAAHRDITFSLMTMGQDTKVAEADRKAADVVLTSLHGQRPPAGHDQR
jgi:hypothetical protein